MRQPCWSTGNKHDSFIAVMTLKGIHCKDKSTNHLHSKSFWSEMERNLGGNSAEIE